jgi:mono/diheme cytochrome c family protein
MKVILPASLFILLIAAAQAASLPGDGATGTRLFDGNCTGCHDTRVMARKDRTVQSLDALKAQLANCAHMANKAFSESEKRDLLTYLNDEFYHFR